MTGVNTIIGKARHAARLDRAIRFVWQAGPKWVVGSAAAMALQGLLPLAAFDLDYYENPRYFDTLHRAQRESPFRPTQIVNTLMRLGQSAVSLIAVSGLLATFHWAVSLVLIAAAAPGIFVRMKFSRVTFDWRREKTPDERMAMYYSWILTGNAHAKEVRLFGIGEEISDRFSRVRRNLRTEKLAISRKRVFADFLVQTFGSLVVFATFGAIVYRAVLGAIILGDMVMFYQAFQPHRYT